MVEVTEAVNHQASQLAKKVSRRRALESRPQTTLQDNIFCSCCDKKMPWQALQKGLFTDALCVDGFIYCAPCAKLVVTGLQALMLKMDVKERANYYKDIRMKIDGEEMRKKNAELLGQGWDEEVDYDDAVKMKKLLKNRDGSMETKPLFQKLHDNVRKIVNKRDEKKIQIGGSGGTK